MSRKPPARDAACGPSRPKCRVDKRVDCNRIGAKECCGGFGGRLTSGGLGGILEWKDRGGTAAGAEAAGRVAHHRIGVRSRRLSASAGRGSRRVSCRSFRGWLLFLFKPNDVLVGNLPPEMLLHATLLE